MITVRTKLIAKIRATEYVHVSMTGIYGIPRFNDSRHVVANVQVGDYRESEIIQNDAVMRAAFLQ